MAVSPSLYAKLPFDTVRDFAPVAQLVKAPLLLVVNNSVPARSVKELIEYSKANPGSGGFLAQAIGHPARCAHHCRECPAGL